MIQKLRNQGFRRMGLGFGLLFLVPIIVELLAQTSARKVGFALSIILAIIGLLVYLFGLVDLAKAKGYESVIVVAILSVCLFCLPIVSIFVVTPVVLFVLKDKTAHYRRHRSSRDALTNVSQILGWFLSLCGGLMVAGFMLFESRRLASLRLSQSNPTFVRPFWIDAVTILEAGALPLVGGILFLRGQYQLLRKAMAWICTGHAALFLLCWIVHLFLPDIAGPWVGVPAAAGLAGGIMSGILWATSRMLAIKMAQRSAVKSQSRKWRPNEPEMPETK